MFTSIIKSKPTEDISILVQLDNHPWNYLCECGDASELTVKEVQNAKAIFISHTHIDHFVNFDAVIRHQLGTGRRVVICGPEGIANQVAAKLHSYTRNLIQAGSIQYEIREVLPESINRYEIVPPEWKLRLLDTTAGNVLLKEKYFVVTGVLLDHKIPVLAYKFKENDSLKIDLSQSGFRGGKWIKELKAAFEQNLPDQPIELGGKAYQAKDLFHLLHVKTGDSLGIIMDHAATAANHALIREHFHACRTALIESFYLDEDQEQAVANAHSHASQSGTVMAEAQVEQPIPVHFSRKYREDQIEAVIREFQEAFTQTLARLSS